MTSLHQNRPPFTTHGLQRMSDVLSQQQRNQPKRGAFVTATTPRRQRGYSLIETLATFSLMSLLAVASVGILNSITENGIDLAHARQSRRDAQRIADTLRDDASRTVTASIPAQQWPVTLEHDKSTTVYDWNPADNILTRTETAGQNKIRKERFLLPEDSEPRMTLANSRITLLIALSDKHSPWVIEGNLKRGATSP